MSVSRPESQRPGPTSGASSSTPVPVVYLPAAGRNDPCLREQMARWGAVVSIANDLPQALAALKSSEHALAVVDLASGDAALSAIRIIHTHFTGLMVTAIMDPADPVISAAALAAGAAGVLSSPCEPSQAMSMVTAARDRMAAGAGGSAAYGSDELFAHSVAMRPVADAIGLVSEGRRPVLVTGDIGTGREFVARHIHARDGEPASRPFIRIDCGAGALELERQIFGTMERGGHADENRLESVTTASAILRAQGGTLLLVHLEEAGARVQARLARVLRDDEAHVSSLGTQVRLNVRVVASTAADVDGAVADGRLRRDLVDRLAAVRINMPPLSRRREDIPMLAALFLKSAAGDRHAPPQIFSRAALTLLMALPWRENARELQDVIARSAKSASGPVIQLDEVLAHVRFDGGSPAPAGGTLRQARAQFEREWISATLARHHGRVGDAAKALGIQRTNLYRKVRQLNVPRTLMSGRK